MASAPLLNYTITTTPVPLQVGASGGAITVVASNPGTYSNVATQNYVAVTKIVIDFGPQGSGGSALTTDPGAVAHAGPSGWSVDVTGLQFTFTAPTANNENHVFPKDGLTFSFTNIKVNDTVGTVPTIITETASSPGGSPPNIYPPQTSAQRSQTTGIGKFPAEFEIQSFGSSQETVAPGMSVQLSWVATNIENASFSLQRAYRGAVETITQHGNGDPLIYNDTFPNPAKGDTDKLRIDGTTTFTLKVKYTDHSTVIQAQDQITISVPDPTITAFTATPATNLRVGNAVTLNWATAAAETVTITPALDGLNSQVEAASSKTVYPLEFTRYTLTASGQGLNVRQSLILFPLEPGWTTVTARAPWSVNTPPLVFSLADLIYIYPGAPGTQNNPAYSSPDGQNWLMISPDTTLPLRTAPALAYSSSAALVMGGAASGGGAPANDVWSTSDGLTWTELTSSAEWSARSGAAAINFGGAYWIMGGQTSGGLVNDIWTSTDGKSWTKASDAAAWPARSQPALRALGSTLYLFGGTGSGGALNDMWTSTDGKTWTQIHNDPFSGSPAPSARAGAVLYGQDGQLMLFGGSDGSTALTDAWFWDQSSTKWTQTNSPVPSGATDFGGMQFNGGFWLMGGAIGSSLGSAVWVYAGSA